jgi:hypothetical protein
VRHQHVGVVRQLVIHLRVTGSRHKCRVTERELGERERQREREREREHMSLVVALLAHS